MLGALLLMPSLCFNCVCYSRHCTNKVNFWKGWLARDVWQLFSSFFALFSFTRIRFFIYNFMVLYPSTRCVCCSLSRALTSHTVGCFCAISVVITDDCAQPRHRNFQHVIKLKDVSQAFEILKRETKSIPQKRWKKRSIACQKYKGRCIDIIKRQQTSPLLLPAIHFKAILGILSYPFDSI